MHHPSFPFQVLDVVLMGRTSHVGYFYSPGKTDEEIAFEHLRFLHIDHLWNKPYTDISGGERQLVLIAAALSQEPELLILDEPTAHLDFGNQHRFLELILALKEKGTGILMTTHSPDHALFLDGKTLILKDGSLWKSGNADSIITPETMSELYKLDVHISQYHNRKICIPGQID